MNKKIIIGVFALVNSLTMFGFGLVQDVVQGATNVAETAVEGAADVGEAAVVGAGNVTRAVVGAPRAVIYDESVYGPYERTYYERPYRRYYRGTPAFYPQPVVEEVIAE